MFARDSHRMQPFWRASQVLERFTIEHMVNQYADLYSDLLIEEAN